MLNEESRKLPNVSVIIPVYNVEAYLRQCLDSVVNQTLRDIEIICIDDGSTDGSPAILAEYAAKDQRVKVLIREHTNAGAARNAGMSVATGEYLGFVDSDDWCELTLFEKAYNKAKTDNADVVSWLFVTYDNRTKKCGPPRVFEDNENPFAPLAYAPWQRLHRRSFIEENKIFFQSIVRANDVYFCCMSLALARKKSLLSEALYFYRVGMSTNLQANNAKSPMTIIQAWSMLAGELTSRGMYSEFESQFCSAATNSLFYTLNSISRSKAYAKFFEVLRDLYDNDPVFSKIKASAIVNLSNRKFLLALRPCKSPLTFLVKQANYLRERTSDLYWSRQSYKSKADDLAQKFAESQRARRINWEDAQRLKGELDAANERFRKGEEVRKGLEGRLSESQRARRVNWEDAQRLKGELEIYQSIRLCRWIRHLVDKWRR